MNLTKRFGDVAVLSGITCSFVGGKIVGLVGANGAGKSTFLNCLAGLLKPDSGSLTLNGINYEPRNSAQARGLGVRFAPQELGFFPDLTIAENWKLLTDGESVRRNVPNYGTPNNIAASFLQPANVQRLILDAINADSTKVLLLDEPTALLEDEAGQEYLNHLKRIIGPKTIVIISTHRLKDLERLDRWLFLKDGSISLDTAIFSVARTHYLASDDEGGKSNNGCSRHSEGSNRVVAEADINTCAFGKAHFSILSGEILGVTAPSGAPLFEIARSLSSTLKSRSLRVAFLGPERQLDHVMPHLNVGDHVSLALDADLEFSKTGHFFKKMMDALGISWGPELRKRPIISLSGGTQQKLFVALNLLQTAEVRILCDPLRGVDQASARAVLELLRNRPTQSVPRIIFTHDLEFLMNCADRIAIAKIGVPMGFFSTNEFSSIGSLRELL